MPEGDTIFRAARTLHRALAGHVVVRFESVLPALTRVDEDHPIVGRTIDSVAARGKHLLMTFSGDLVLHTHMRMNGSWHVYRPAEQWQRPRRDMRLLVATDRFVAVGFNVPVAEFLTSAELAKHRDLRMIGPDLADPAFDREKAIQLIRAHGDQAIGDALLNQRIVAGIGNVLKSEVLYVAGVHPFARARDVNDDDLQRIVTVARELIQANVSERLAALGPAVGRRTTRSLDPNAKLWVYGRRGRPCRRCGTTVQARKTGTDARLTYWCPQCQTAGLTAGT